MKKTSILNHVIGPVMRGPSSSHTAAAYHMAHMAACLLGEAPVRADLRFDADGSYGRTFREQGADLAFAIGLLGRRLTDEGFADALADVASMGMTLSFEVCALDQPDHPNTVEMDLHGVSGRHLGLRANSIGGGAVEVTQVDGHPTHLVGDTHDLLLVVSPADVEGVARLLPDGCMEVGEPVDGRVLVQAHLLPAPDPDWARELEALPGVERVLVCEPIYHVCRGAPLVDSAAGMVALADERGMGLGEVALAQESALLGMPSEAVAAEMARRLEIMSASVRQGLAPGPGGMRLLSPTAGAIYAAEARGGVAVGGLHTRAAARAMAAMQVNSSGGVVCAAPTGGSAGVLPGVLVTLMEECNVDRERATCALMAAGAVGLVVANRATFAAEVAGCQVEIGAAGAMAAAAVVDAMGGSAGQALHAAAIAFQNTMGSVCDLVQGIVEIPCHTRNGAAAANAFLCADMVMGGYANPVGLDETVDAVYAVGKMLPPELRCTALGGLACAPSARAMPRLG